MVEKSSKSRVAPSGPAQRMTSTPSGRWAMSRTKRAWMAMRRALTIPSTGRFDGWGVTMGGEHRRTTMRVAPASMARWIGTLSTTPPSM